jgi:hypothetical protein
MKVQGSKPMVHSISGVDEEADSLSWRFVRVGVILGAVVLFVLVALL